MKIKNIALFASGEGTNVQNIINYFKKSNQVKIGVVVSNKPDARALARAANAGISTLIISKKDFYNSLTIVDELKKRKVNLIVLSGFLWKVPENLITAFTDKIINVHPALLPKYGGKGMYGMNIHKAVIAAKEKESGITIHYVNEHYDEGKIIVQYKCTITENDTPETLAMKIAALELIHFPKTIENLIV